MKALRAFVVEDSPVIRENLVATLEEVASLQVVGTAEDEAGAIEFLTDPSRSCDIAIIDIFLARGSGMGVLRAMRDAGVQTERVVLTNYATDDIRRHCLALGATRVFDKSAEIDALVTHCLDRAEQA
jgi:DNA-binding NarL/FixJ family response regulator